jgi:hypothetical protein
MNTSAQPAEGAGGSRSRAAGELTLGLLSGEERRGVGCSAFALLWERGKSAKVALIACMRILLIRLNAMLRDGTEWR